MFLYFLVIPDDVFTTLFFNTSKICAFLRQDSYTKSYTYVKQGRLMLNALIKCFFLYDFSLCLNSDHTHLQKPTNDQYWKGSKKLHPLWTFVSFLTNGDILTAQSITTIGTLRVTTKMGVCYASSAKYFLEDVTNLASNSFIFSAVCVFCGIPLCLKRNLLLENFTLICKLFSCADPVNPEMFTFI